MAGEYPEGGLLIDDCWKKKDVTGYLHPRPGHKALLRSLVEVSSSVCSNTLELPQGQIFKAELYDHEEMHMRYQSQTFDPQLQQFPMRSTSIISRKLCPSTVWCILSSCSFTPFRSESKHRPKARETAPRLASHAIRGHQKTPSENT
eukprot:5640408-Amphidinium_carterae.2